MLGFKPNHKLWKRVNRVIMGENAADVMITFISAMCSMLIDARVAANETQARVHLAAMLLSPDDNPRPGSLVPLLAAELARLNDGKWLT